MKKILILVILFVGFSSIYGQHLTTIDGNESTLDGGIPLDGGICNATLYYNNQPVQLAINVNSSSHNLQLSIQSQSDCIGLKATNNVDWITLPSTNLFGSFTVNVSTNNTPNLRSSVIFITDYQDNTVSVFSIRQEGNTSLVAYYTDSDGDGFGDFNSEPKYSSTPITNLVTNNFDYCPNEPSLLNNGCIDAETDKRFNWTRSYAYDRDGKLISGVKEYFNDIGKAIQTQFYDLKTKKIWAEEIRYDTQGRIALQTLNAPITNEVGEVSFTYKEGFIKKSDGSNFTVADFEGDEQNPSIVGSSPLTLGHYYSSLNNIEKLRDITDRPYTRTLYSDLNPGRVKQIIGGNKINNDWKQDFSFVIPAAQELYYLFGYENYNKIGDDVFEYSHLNKLVINSRNTKIITEDVHGNQKIDFKDPHGKLIATAKAGGDKQYEVISLVDKDKRYVDIHLTEGCENSLTFIGEKHLFKMFNLKSEKEVSDIDNIDPGFYRIYYILQNETINNCLFSCIELDKSNNSLLVNQNANVIGVRYKVNYYSFSFYEYDETGRLKSSTQPLGFNNSSLNVLGANSIHNSDLQSTYSYNTLGQLVSITSPDEGIANSKYREDGQIRFSQNSEQLLVGEFSYTNYDELGRPIESGVCTGAFSSLNSNTGNDFTGGRKDQLLTKYDFLENTDVQYLQSIDGSYSTPSFLTGNIAKTYNLDTDGDEISATYYSYDIYGRVKWAVQKIQIAGEDKSITLDYEYDPVTSQVVKVIFQKNTPEELFIHRYTYNQDTDELIKVETSTDNISFITHADYLYYQTGAIRRTSLAEGIQEIDYIYNLAGQLKAINHPSLATDPEINPNGTDLFGLSLDYYINDYRRDNKFTEYSSGQDQYNGNIKSMTWNTDVLQNGQSTPLQYSYEYDKNNWLTAATFASTNNNLPLTLELYELVTTSTHKKAANSIVLKDGFSAKASGNVTFKAQVTGSVTEFGTNDYNVSNIRYDANGNIESLHRNKNTENGSNRMDELSYIYKGNKPNQLDHIVDNVGNTSVGDISSQNPGNYIYNEIGQLIEDFENVSLVEKQAYENNSANIPENLIRYNYNAIGLVTEIKKGRNLHVKFVYNDKNFRTKKISYHDDGITPRKITDYIRNLSGKVVAIYENGSLKEVPIYGKGRLGMYNKQFNTSVYQITDHLGNVRAVIAKQGTDAIALTSTTDYYPFGMPMPGRQTIKGESYRYGYQGEFAETDQETGKPAFQLRLWDARIGRWLSPDPAGQYHSPYMGMGNNPINGVDPDGAFFGTIVGAVVGGVTAAITGDSILGGIASGAIAGAIVDVTIATGGGALAVIGAGVAAGATDSVLNDVFNGREISGKRAVISGALGGLLGPAARVFGRLTGLSKIAKKATIHVSNLVEESSELGKILSNIEKASIIGGDKAFSVIDDVLIEAAQVPSKGGLTAVGRALQKHGSRAGSKFPRPRGNQAQMNSLGLEVLQEILTDSNALRQVRHHGRFGEILEVIGSNGRGVRFSSDGKLFIGFLE
ncbi:RHS repeat-associated core domain-containing protein [Tenacibaculum sp. 190524A05c]|uniref:RHS repeat-associated protein n=1 Tax=Tenacibaculum platacis TaxID=3137852 RepID=A0ABP1EKB2_9FLAO